MTVTRQTDNTRGRVLMPRPLPIQLPHLPELVIQTLGLRAVLCLCRSLCRLLLVQLSIKALRLGLQSNPHSVSTK